MTSTADATHELAAFLRTRRERLAPGDVALPHRARARRTPGLRREEVAELAGVSVDYVIRLEQGRGMRPSRDVLDGLSQALMLSDDERAYLFDLAAQPPAAPRRTPPGPATHLVHDLSPLPAMLVNHRFDVLAWNPEMAALMLDFAEVAEERRNTMWLCMLDDRLTGFYRDRERVVREGIADLRAAWAAHRDDDRLTALIEELTARSEEFALLWERRDVRVNARGQKRLVHRLAGPLTVSYEALAPLEHPGHRLIVYRAADPASRAALDTITRSVA